MRGRSSRGTLPPSRLETLQPLPPMRLAVSMALALAVAVLGGSTLAGVSSPSPERPPEARVPATPAAPLPASPLPAPNPPTSLQEVTLQRVPGQEVPRQEAPGPTEYREFYFTRAIYSDYGGGFWGRRRPSWATDFPKADHQFLVVLKRLIGIDAYDRENAVPLDDPALRRFPFIYAVEVGRMDLTESEVQGLRSYLEAGGFLVVDDFWGSREWANFEYQMARVFPGRTIEPLPMDHPLFNMVYDIDEIRQVPNVGNGTRGGPTHERDGFVPQVLGISDDDGRLMVVVNWNTDLGDAWEWAENPFYPLEYSTFAYEMGVNMIVYGLSH